MVGTSSTQSVKFRFTKSPTFKDIHIDGVWGGVHGRRYIRMAVFRDKSHLPNVVEYKVGKDGRLGEETSRELPDSITREIEVDIEMSLAVATLMRDWLNVRIAEMTTSQSPGSNVVGEDSGDSEAG